MGQITIAEALNNIRDNKYVMPAFQRDFVWNISQVEKLWDSILQDYPISNFLFWKIDENNVSEDTNFCYFLKDVCFNNAKQPKSANYELFGVSFEKTDTAVLDGQQRLTSLYLSLLGNAEILAKHAHNHKNGIRSKLVIELNQNKLDVEEEGYNSKKYDIRFTDKTGLLSPTQFEIRKLMEPAFQSENYRNSEFEKIIAMVPSESKQYARQLLNKLYSKIFTEPLINYTELVDMQQEDALEVFVRFNSGGKALAKSDISMAILESYWPSSKTEFGTVLQDSYADFGTDFIIRTALMLYANVVKSNISKNTAMTLKNDWENFKQTLIKLEKLLKSFNIEVSRFSSSWNVLLPIIYAIHYNPDYQDNAEEIKIYLLRAVLFTYFQSGTTGKLNILKNMLNEYDRKFDRLWLDNNIRALELNDAKIEDILNSQKKDRVTGEALFYLNRDWIETKADYELDHLHPYAGFDRDVPPNVTPENWIKWRQNRDKIANLWPLIGRDNGIKNDDPLEIHYSKMTKEQQNNFRKQAMIPENIPLDIQHFDKFYEARKEILKEKLKELLGGK